jgi:hypothetical protein
MGKLRIEKPSGPPSHRKKRKSRVPVLLAALIVAAAGWGGYLYLVPASELPVLEVTNFSGAVEISDASGTPAVVQRGSVLKPGQVLKTGDGADAELALPGKIKFRVKPNSEFRFEAPLFYEKQPPLRFLLERGELYAATDKNAAVSSIELRTPQLISKSEGGYYFLRANPQDKTSWIGQMRGKASVKKSGMLSAWTELKGLQGLQAGPGSAGAPQNISKDEWKQMAEIYELTAKSAAVEAMQLDLSKDAGSLFKFVFDHGTFYTPKVGYAGREFFKDDSSGEVYLEVEYDVFPKGTFVGMYIKTRGLDLSGYSHLEFEMRRVEDEAFPQSIRMELKSKSGIARAFAAKLPKTSWEKVSFPLHVKTSTLLTEIALVFFHDRVGEEKKGSVQFRRINLVPVEKAATPGTPVPALENTAVAVSPASETPPVAAPASVPASAPEPAGTGIS